MSMKILTRCTKAAWVAVCVCVCVLSVHALDVQSDYAKRCPKTFCSLQGNPRICVGRWGTGIHDGCNCEWVNNGCKESAAGQREREAAEATEERDKQKKAKSDATAAGQREEANAAVAALIAQRQARAERGSAFLELQPPVEQI